MAKYIPDSNTTPPVINADTVTTNANLTGHVTSVGNAAVLGSFTVAQLNTAISNATLSGNNTGDQTNVSGTAATVTGAAQTNITSVGILTSLKVSGNVLLTNLPTSDPENNGQIWNNNGVLNISTG
jgi:hypothetical protein